MMDVCMVNYGRPEPVEGRVEGVLRLDVRAGECRLLGELRLREPVRLHRVELAGSVRVWEVGGRRLRGVRVYNRSTLPMDQVMVTAEEAPFVAGTVRVNGESRPLDGPAEGIVLPGLDAGGSGIVTWQESAAAAPRVLLRGTYRFGAEQLEAVRLLQAPAARP